MFELKVKVENKRRQKERQDQEEKARIEQAEVERQSKETDDMNRVAKEEEDKKKEKEAAERLKALEAVQVDAHRKTTSGVADDSVFEGDTAKDFLIIKMAGLDGQEVNDSMDVPDGADPVAQVQDKALMIAMKHRAWLEERERLAMP